MDICRAGHGRRKQLLMLNVFLQGHLFIEKCEKYCWYCYELWGDTSNWKHAW